MQHDRAAHVGRVVLEFTQLHLDLREVAEHDERAATRRVSVRARRRRDDVVDVLGRRAVGAVRELAPAHEAVPIPQGARLGVEELAEPRRTPARVLPDDGHRAPRRTRAAARGVFVAGVGFRVAGVGFRDDLLRDAPRHRLGGIGAEARGDGRRALVRGHVLEDRQIDAPRGGARAVGFRDGARRGDAGQRPPKARG